MLKNRRENLQNNITQGQKTNKKPKSQLTGLHLGNLVWKGKAVICIFNKYLLDRLQTTLLLIVLPIFYLE